MDNVRLPSLAAPKKPKKSELVIKKLSVIDSAAGLYGKTLSLQSIDRNMRQEVKEVVKAMPVGLPADSNCSTKIKREATRVVLATSSVTLPAIRGNYSEYERRNGIEAYLYEKLSYEVLFERFGIPKRTVQKDITALKAKCKMIDKSKKEWREYLDSNKLAVIDMIQNRMFTPPGPVPLINTVELDIIRATANCGGESGLGGMTRRGLGVECREFCHSIAGTEQDPAIKKRLEEAKCGKNFIQKHFKKEDPAASFRKQSSISMKRAAAGNPSRSVEMVRRHKAFLQEVREEYGYPLEWPGPKDVANYDETSSNELGRTEAILSTNKFRLDGQKTSASHARRGNLAGGEHAELHASLGVTTVADGTLLPFITTHKSADDEQISPIFLLNAHPDLYTNVTLSGLNDCNGTKVVAKMLMEHWSPEPGNGHVLLWDGHYSHFDVESIQALKQAGIYVLILKAQDSKNDQSNDLGINALLKAMWDHIVAYSASDI